MRLPPIPEQSPTTFRTGSPPSSSRPWIQQRSPRDATQRLLNGAETQPWTPRTWFEPALHVTLRCCFLRFRRPVSELSFRCHDDFDFPLFPTVGGEQKRRLIVQHRHKKPRYLTLSRHRTQQRLKSRVCVRSCPSGRGTALSRGENACHPAV